MAGLPARLRIQPADVKAAAMWGVAAATGGLYLVQDLRTVPCSAPRIWRVYILI
ncbi:hypothetical protein LR48_Vigan04g122900 [Vigna angularis]|uniref:Uncharacterized protein n=1 Tax=Phaseolus angularis TaxID=3914 RepID=A0A0L9UEA5_PHAAN|nr:hypothetical protein LR48_Vigan04g122900 [Vigna angularis]